MGYKMMVDGLRLGNILIFIGIAIGLLGSTWSQMVAATVDAVTNGSNASDVMHFKQYKDNPTQVPINQEEAINHINESKH